jgi:hypothetical protein
MRQGADPADTGSWRRRHRKYGLDEGAGRRASTGKLQRSKGGLVMLTRTLALDLAPFRIRVNAVAPGVIRTPLIAHILDAQPGTHFGAIPWGRVGLPEEVASCIVFLASDDASYVTGEIFVVDGGQLAINGQVPDDYRDAIAARLSAEEVVDHGENTEPGDVAPSSETSGGASPPRPNHPRLRSGRHDRRPHKAGVKANAGQERGLIW